MARVVKRTPLKRKPRRRSTPLERELRARWKAATGRTCMVCPVEGGECDGPIQGHHVVSQEQLKLRGLARLVETLWDLRNKLDVCRRRHDLHTRAIKPIPLELVPAAALEFATEHRLEWWVEKHYAA